MGSTEGAGKSRPKGHKKPLIRLRDCSKVHDNGTVALSGVSLAIDGGEWVTVTGRSGAGKSTLLGIIGSLDRPTSGTVTVGGQRLDGMTVRELAEFRSTTVGFVFQRYYLLPYLNVLENVTLAQHFCKGEDIAAAKEVLRGLGLGNRLDHLPDQLSGGEQQRVCIARAVINGPRVLLADEPTGNLDRVNSGSVFEALVRLHREGTTIVLVTHDSALATWGTRVVRLTDGKLVSSDAVKEGTARRSSSGAKQHVGAGP